MIRFSLFFFATNLNKRIIIIQNGANSCLFPHKAINKTETIDDERQHFSVYLSKYHWQNL